VGACCLGAVLSSAAELPAADSWLRDSEAGVVVVAPLAEQSTSTSNFLVLVAPTSYDGLAGVGSGIFQFINPAVPWNPDGNTLPFDVPSAYVRAVPDPGSYRFAWLAGGEIGDIQKRMPATSDTQLNALVGLSGFNLVYYLFSRAYLPGVDDFGDIDADGLSDRWESDWFGYGSSDDIGSTAATDPKASTGADGNPDGDFLPLASTVVVTNVIEGGFVKAYRYPLSQPLSAVGPWTGYLPHLNHPFKNLVEYRGLEEDRGDGRGWIRRALESPLPTSPQRGNDPATNPSLIADTDGDGMDDGWEYYFWTTILYEIGAETLWRAQPSGFDYFYGQSPSNDDPVTQIVTVEERVGTYNPNDLSYSGKLHDGVVVDSVTMTAGQYIYSDNGAGVLVGNTSMAGSGAIDYSSGAWAITMMANPVVSGNIIATYSYEVQFVLDYTPDPGLPLLKRGLPPQRVEGILLERPYQTGRVEETPVKPGTFAIAFDTGAVFVDDGHGGLTNDVYDIDGATGATNSVAAVQVLGIDYETGAWWVAPHADVQTGSVFAIDYEVVDGAYTKDQLLAAFDPAFSGEAESDIDQDGLYDWEEFLLGTNPIHFDSDGDSMPDGGEIEFGLDPLHCDIDWSSDVRIAGPVAFNENALTTNLVQVALTSIATTDVVFSVTGYIPGYVEGDETVTFAAGTDTACVGVLALNGPTNCTLVLTPSSESPYWPASVAFPVGNVPPSILSAGASAYAVVEGGSVTLQGSAVDPSTDTLAYAWSFSDGSPTLLGESVTKTFDQVGTIRATFSVTDQDGESDCTSFDVYVGQSEPVTIQFTEITPEAITFRIPSTAKGNDYQVWTSTRLAAHDSEWVDWLPIAGSNLVAGGQFRAISLQVPSFEVPIEVTDGSKGSSFIRVDISEIFSNHSNHYFRIELPAPSPGE